MEIFSYGHKEIPYSKDSETIGFYCKRCARLYFLLDSEVKKVTSHIKGFIRCPKRHILVYPRQIKS